MAKQHAKRRCIIRKHGMAENKFLQRNGSWGAEKTAAILPSDNAAEKFAAKHGHSDKSYGLFPVSRRNPIAARPTVKMKVASMRRSSGVRAVAPAEEKWVTRVRHGEARYTPGDFAPVRASATKSSLPSAKTVLGIAAAVGVGYWLLRKPSTVV